MIRRIRIAFLAIVFLTITTPPVLAAGGAEEPRPATIMFWIMIVLVAAKFSSLIVRVGQPAVIGELLLGLILGNLFLFGIPIFEPMKNDPIIGFLAQLGVVVLLFQVGLDTNIEQMSQVGARAFLVAAIGVVMPFVFACFWVAPALLPGLSASAYIFLGGALTATSVSISARVFRDLGKLQTPEARIVLGAAVIDDVFGLIILTVVSAIATVGSVTAESVLVIVLKATLFLAGALFIGPRLAPDLSRAFSRIQTGVGMKFTLAFGFCLGLAFLAEQVGLAAIVGAFAAGVILDPVHFRQFDDPKIVDDLKETTRTAEPELRARVLNVINEHADRHINDLLEPLSHFLVPLFFVLTGMAVRLDSILNPSIVAIALVITAVGLFGKLVAGIAAGSANKLIVGVGMWPRGEVELIFAATGKALGIFSDQIYAIIVLIVILSTLFTPPVLAWLIRREDMVRR